MHFAYETAVKYDKDFIRIYFFYEIIEAGRGGPNISIYYGQHTQKNIKKRTKKFIVTPPKSFKTIEE